MTNYSFLSEVNPGSGWRHCGPLGIYPIINLPVDPKAQLVAEIGKFLCTDENVAQIDFHLGRSRRRIHITGTKLQGVGIRLKAGKLKFEIDDAKLKKHGYGAMFTRGNKQFTFRSGVLFSPEEIKNMPAAMAIAVRESVFRGDALTSGLVVHEAVHALLEYEERRLIQLSDEAAGYLAQTLYHIYNGTYDWLIDKAGVEGEKIYKASYALVEKHHLDKSSGVHLTWLQYRPLRQAIQAHTNYNYLGPLMRYR